MEIRPPKTCGFYTETQVELAKKAAQILSNDLRQHIPIPVWFLLRVPGKADVAACRKRCWRFRV